jgi:hypothetical protein
MPKLMRPAHVVAGPQIERHIRVIRGQRVLPDHEGLEPAVRRNLERFPEDFLWQLAGEETSTLRSQIVTLTTGRGRHVKYAPLALTEQGIAMPSSACGS